MLNIPLSVSLEETEPCVCVSKDACMLIEVLCLVSELETTLKSANSKRTMVFSSNGMLLAMRVNNLAIGNKK